MHRVVDGKLCHRQAVAPVLERGSVALQGVNQYPVDALSLSVGLLMIRSRHGQLRAKKFKDF
ncbi:hypothetical protein PF003_g38155 [Phytophthora fragariae]|nr:hypothetical protein PF003_g38155 [Phytophthora fragariae]